MSRWQLKLLDDDGRIDRDLGTGWEVCILAQDMDQPYRRLIIPVPVVGPMDAASVALVSAVVNAADRLLRAVERLPE